MTDTPDKSSENLEVDVLAYALTSLGNHAAAMDQADEEIHDGCSFCETMKLLSRISAFGIQLRQAEQRMRPVS